MTDDNVSPAEQARRDDVAETARKLKTEVEKLRGDVKNFRIRAERADKRSLISALLCAGLILTAIWLGVVTFQTRDTATRNAATNDRLDSLVQGAFCPLYGLIIGGYDPGTRALNSDGSYEGSDRQKYVDGFDGPLGLREQLRTLRCTGDLIPPRTDG